MDEGNLFSIKPVSTPQDLQDVAILFQEYATSLKIDLSFQDFAVELASMPGKYSHPTGFLLLARSPTGQAIGCIGVRSLEGLEISEMKRLYVSPQGRGTGLGRALAQKALDQARQLGYRRIRLDTLRSMTSARSLYEKLGFYEIEPYYHNPLVGTCFLELNFC